jgi:hypothetical protein
MIPEIIKKNIFLTFFLLVLIIVVIYNNTHKQKEHWNPFGSSKSRSTVNINNTQLVMNTQNISVMTDNVNRTVAEEIMKKSTECSSATQATQTMDLGNIVTKGPNTKVGIKQGQNVKVDLSCISNNDIKSTMTTAMINEMSSNLTSSNNQEVMSKLAAAAKSDSTSGFLALGSTSSDSNTNITNDLTSITEINKSITARVENEVKKSLESQDMSKITSSLIAEQNLRAGNITALEGAEVNIGQEITVEVVAKLIANSNVANTTATSVMNAFGIVNSDEVKQSSKADVSATAESKAESRGPAESIAAGFAAIIAALTGSIGAIVIGLALIGLSGGLIIFRKKIFGGSDAPKEAPAVTQVGDTQIGVNQEIQEDTGVQGEEDQLNKEGEGEQNQEGGFRNYDNITSFGGLLSTIIKCIASK